MARLEKRFPDEIGENANPEYVPCAPLTDDAEYQRFVRLGAVIREVQSKVPLVAHDTLSTLIRRERGPRSVADVRELIAEKRAESRYPYTPPW
jgi:hypothetical protein